tara:strand:+ start:626 stop:784 length:159 start_codon:yes stop_codon:yes gene_type:complete
MKGTSQAFAKKLSARTFVCIKGGSDRAGFHPMHFGLAADGWARDDILDAVNA